MLPRVTKNLAGQDIDRHAQRANAVVVADPSTDRELTEEELLLTSPIVYGFSFADKQWCECFLCVFLALSLALFSDGICSAAENLLFVSYPIQSSSS